MLGIWDGHDAGAALLQGDRIVFAVNEERLTRRKLEVGFPRLSVRACLDHADLSPADIREIAASTTDPAKTLTRLFPGLKEEYYLLRRRKIGPRRFDAFKKRFKYRFTELSPNPLSRWLSDSHLRGEISVLGFREYRLALTDHHRGHAEAAARSSSFDECLVLTLDGVGDGLCGSLWHFRGGMLELIRRLPGRASFGIFFEHVTNLMNMRELEDEGKVMALANYAYPVEDHENPLMDIVRTQGLDIVSPLSSTEMFLKLKIIFWRFPSEQFAFMAQRVLEKNILDLVRNALAHTGLNKIALAGGVFSNVKVNMKIGELDGLEGMFVFPHMGDGGLAMGAAMEINHERFGVDRYTLRDLYLGPAYGEEDILAALKDGKDPFRRVESPAREAARLILNGEIILWFQGRMEIGPRALGNRSILARPDDRGVKNRLNLYVKNRVWYQPFCPSMLIEDAPALLALNGQRVEDNRFMTTAFLVRPDALKLMEGVINIDGTCRPQFVGDENPRYRDLLLTLRGELGRGVVLNTSFNIHGEPMVCSPRDALSTLKKTGIRYLFLEDYCVENSDAKVL